MRNLHRVINEAAKSEGCRLDDLTVISREADPYRFDTPTGHRNGAWVAEQRDLLGLTQPFGLHELHELILVHGNMVKPNGGIYTDTGVDWKWLSETAGPSARWLGYTSWTSDNDEGLRFLPEAKFASSDPFTLTILGEEQSLIEVALPIAREYHATLRLVSGEAIETDLFREARFAGFRRSLVFTLSDPQWSVSIARKVQALRDQFVPNLEFEIISVPLTAIRPDVLREIITEAMDACVAEILDPDKFRASPSNLLISSGMSWLEATRALRRHLGDEP